jgi:hypothetical protein
VAEKVPTLNVPRQCPLVLLVEICLKKGKAEEVKNVKD